MKALDQIMPYITRWSFIVYILLFIYQFYVEIKYAILAEREKSNVSENENTERD